MQKDEKSGQERRGIKNIGDFLKRGSLFSRLAELDPCDDENCPICGEGKAHQRTPKDRYHFSLEAKLEGARTEAIYLEAAVSKLLDEKTKLTERLEAANKEAGANIEEIKALRRRLSSFAENNGHLHEANNRLNKANDDLGLKLRLTFESEQKLHEAMVQAILVLGPMNSKSTRSALKAAVGQIREILDAPSEPPPPQ